MAPPAPRPTSGGSAVAGKRFAALSPDLRLGVLIAGLLLIRLALYGWLAGGLHALPTALCHWDCDWYWGVATGGYPTHPKTVPGPTFGQATWAFFPVYPALIAGTARLLGLQVLVAAISVANLALCIFAFLAVKYLQLIEPARSGPALALFLFAFPGSLYFSLPYSEAVYAVFAIAAFWCLARRGLLAARGVAAVGSATRVYRGVLAPGRAMPYLIAFWRALRRGDRAGTANALSAALLPVALAPLGLFLFMLYLYIRTGDGLAFLHIQRAWGRFNGNPIVSLWQGLARLDLLSFAPRTTESTTLNALSAVAGLLLSTWLLIRRRYAESWFLAMTIVIPITHGMDSLSRYTMAQPLFLVFLFDFIATFRSRLVFWSVIGVCVPLQLFLVRLWMQGYAFLH